MTVLIDRELDEELIKRRAISGTVILALRRLILQIVQTTSTVILARILFPKTFGQFAILIFVVEFFALLVSQGLVSALIQAKSKMGQREAATVFWFVLVASWLPFGFLWFGALAISDLWQADLKNSVFLVRMTLPVVFLINLKLLLSSILERQIKFVPVAIVDITESLVVALVSIFLVFRGLALEALIIGYMVGKIGAVILLFWFSTFRPTFEFAFGQIKKLASFALNYQLYSLVNSVSGAIAPLYVGRIVGVAGTGYLSWAGGIGLIPWAFAELIARITFPVFSRLGDNKKLFGEVFGRVLDLKLMVVMPLAVILIVYATPITNIIFTYKWLPAVWAFRYFVLLGTVVSLCAVASSALLALGEAKFVRNIALISAFIFWIWALVLIPKIGFTGHPLAWFLGSSVQLILIYYLKKKLKVAYFEKIFIYLSLSLVAVLPYWLMVKTVGSLFGLVSVISLMMITYVTLVFLFRRESVFYYFRQLKSIVKLGG